MKTPTVKAGDTVTVVDSNKRVHTSSTVTVVGTEAIQAKDEAGKIYDALKHQSDVTSAPYYRLSSESATHPE